MNARMSQEIQFFEEAFNVLNEKYFESALSKRPIITIQSRPGTNGHCTNYGAWRDIEGSTYKEINLEAQALNRPLAQTIATLIHEMVHYYCYLKGIQDVSRNNTYHNKRFKQEAEKRAILISYSPDIGYSVTKPSDELVMFVKNMGWEDVWERDIKKLYRNPIPLIPVNRGGPEKVFGGSEKKKSSTRKYTCPKCGLSVRATKTVRIGCLDCGGIEMIVNQNTNLAKSNLYTKEY